jgi:hypothetical protein
MNHLPRPVENVKAELFLAALIESCSDVVIEPSGVFSRNYDEDIIAIDGDDGYSRKMTVRLSRDSLFHTLPQGLFFKENTLKDLSKQNAPDKFKHEQERILKEKRKILSFFQPFDTTYFRLRFDFEKKMNELSANRLQILFDELFDVFELNSDNPLIRKIIPLLPIASEIRGNKYVMRDVLQGVFFPSHVEMSVQNKRGASGKAGNRLVINVNIEKLSAAQFRNLIKEAEAFIGFFYEWFLPFDLDYELKIKDKKERFVLGKTMTLDYNTHI